MRSCPKRDPCSSGYCWLDEIVPVIPDEMDVPDLELKSPSTSAPFVDILIGPGSGRVWFTSI